MIQQFREFDNNGRQNRNPNGKVSNPILFIGSLDFGPQFLFRDLSFHCFAILNRLLLLFKFGQVLFIDPVVFSGLAGHGFDEGTAFSSVPRELLGGSGDAAGFLLLGIAASLYTVDIR